MDINDRIKEIRKVLKLKQGEVAEKIGIRQSSLSDIENKRVNVSDRVVKDICREFNVNEEWLRYGNGPMFLSTPIPALEQLVKEYNLNDLEYRFLFEYFKLDIRTRKAVATYLSNVFNSNATPSASFEEISATSESSNSIETAEETYKKSLGIVQKTDYTALNTINGIEGKRAL